MKINQIKINDSRRVVDVKKVNSLANSIKEIGLLNPITINIDGTLIAGAHRLDACKLLGYDEIEVNILNVSDLIAELAEIDENLIRNDLHWTDADKQMARRKNIYLELNPETANGMRNGQTNPKNEKIAFLEKQSFTEEASEMTSQSKRNIEMSVKRGNEITTKEVEVIKQAEAPKSFGNELIKLPKPMREKVIEKLKKSDKKNSVKAILQDIRFDDMVHKRPNLSQLHTGDEESYTPKCYIESARKVMGGITIDPASNPKAQETVKADNYYTKNDDGLTKQWKGNVWLNPPYTARVINVFLEKIVSEYTNGNLKQAIILTNNNTDTNWFHDTMKVANAVCFTKGRINFIKPNGDKSFPTNGQMFFYVGNNIESFKEEFSSHGLIMIK